MQELQRVLSRCLDFLYAGTDTPSGLQVHCDYMLVIKAFEAQLTTWKDRWIVEREWRGVDQQVITYKKLIAHFYYNYAVLVLNSFGLQNALERAPVDLGHFFAQCHSSATMCATLVRDELGPRGYMKYAPDSHCVMISYAVLSLLKLIRPEFHPFLDDEQRTLALVADVADTLEGCAANAVHTPALYAQFLRALIAAKSTPAAAPSPSPADANPTDAEAQQHQHQQQQQQQQEYTSNDTGDATANMGYGSVYGGEPGYMLHPFQFSESEMGPVQDMSVFPPTMAPNPTEGNMGSLTMDTILSSGFWDSVIVPGYNSMDGLTGGFLFGAGGSGLITPRFGLSPVQSGTNTPGSRGGLTLTQHSINAAFGQDGAKVEVSPTPTHPPCVTYDPQDTDPRYAFTIPLLYLVFSFLDTLDLALRARDEDNNPPALNRISLLYLPIAPISTHIKNAHLALARGWVPFNAIVDHDCGRGSRTAPAAHGIQNAALGPLAPEPWHVNGCHYVRWVTQYHA
ncbi:hypothetical protein DXG01_004066 [Tephrocybe rancida]|nr:hypothetical protein DXG01_004066 [Tephrocybe rancida]